MTPQQTAGAVHRLPRITARTVRQPATAETGQHRRISAPIEEQHHLLAARQNGVHTFKQWRRYTALQRLIAHIQQIDARRLGVAGTLIEPQVPVTIGLHIAQRFKRWRGRPKYHRALRTLPTHDRQVARRITETLGLLERRIVFFVDDHQAQIGDRREDR